MSRRWRQRRWLWRRSSVKSIQQVQQVSSRLLAAQRSILSLLLLLFLPCDTRATTDFNPQPQLKLPSLLPGPLRLLPSPPSSSPPFLSLFLCRAVDITAIYIMVPIKIIEKTPLSLSFARDIQRMGTGQENKQKKLSPSFSVQNI